MISSSSTNTSLSSYPFTSSPFIALAGTSFTAINSHSPNFVARLILSTASTRSKDSVIPKQPLTPTKASKKELKERALKRERRAVTVSSVKDLEGMVGGFWEDAAKEAGF